MTTEPKAKLTVSLECGHQGWIYEDEAAVTFAWCSECNRLRRFTISKPNCQSERGSSEITCPQCQECSLFTLTFGPVGIHAHCQNCQHEWVVNRQPEWIKP